MNTFFRPHDGVAADFIPFVWQGDYHLFYLKDLRDPENHGEGTPWFHLVTRDFITFEDWGEALPRGTKEEQDLYVFTGSVIEKDGVFTIFYTGHNPHLRAAGKPEQAIMRATSPDLRTWTKETDLFFFAPAGYEMHDWRDPFVLWDEAADEYRMLITARHPEGPLRRSGCIALAGSADLQSWQMRADFRAPRTYYTPECTDLFRIGDWWYLIYSDAWMTQYRMSRSMDGPWQCPANPTFDTHPYYAAKSAASGAERFLFGWLATRFEEKDDTSSHWQWGGDLVVHRLVQQPDGTLSARMPETIGASFNQSVALEPAQRLGKWDISGESFATSAREEFAVVTLGEMPKQCLVEASLTFAPGTAVCGLLLRTDASLDSGYEVRLEPARNRIVLDPFPPYGDDRSFWLERPLALKPGHPIHLRLLIDGTCLVVYANDEVALSCRLYNKPVGCLGLFVGEGDARFENVSVKTRP